jgi:hypothetical protein
MHARKRIEGKSSFIFLRCSFVMKKGLKIKDAIRSLEKTNVMGPTSGAEIFINRKEDPQATPMAIMRDQSITVFLYINILFLFKGN